jgi:hypothetical protein
MPVLLDGMGLPQMSVPFREQEVKRIRTIVVKKVHMFPKKMQHIA